MKKPLNVWFTLGVIFQNVVHSTWNSIWSILGEWDENTDCLWVIWTIRDGTEQPRSALQLDCHRLREGKKTFPELIRSLSNFHFYSPELSNGPVSWLINDLIDLNYYLQVDREDLPSKCKNVPHIDNILLAQLEKQIRKLVRKWHRGKLTSLCKMWRISS